jgi:hypothetical protein
MNPTAGARSTCSAARRLLTRRAVATAFAGIVAVIAGVIVPALEAPAAFAAVNLQVPCAVEGSSGLIAALALANKSGGGVLHLAPGCTYTLSRVVDSSEGGTGLPVLVAPITIDGRSAEIVRSTATSTPRFRILRVGPAGAVSISNLRMSGGNVFTGVDADLGGAIFNEGTISLLDSVTLTSNAADLGGALGNLGSIGTISNATMVGNTAGNGGGVANVAPGRITTLTNCLIARNVAGIGGGIGNNGTIDHLTASSVSDNRLDAATGVVNGAGGGISNAFGTMNLLNDTISGNTATSGPFAAGGGIDDSGQLSLDSSSVTGNVASVLGGGIEVEAQINPAFIVTVSSSQISNNTVVGSGAQVAAGGGIYNGGSIRLDQSNVSSNTVNNPGREADGGGIYADGGSVGTVLNASRVVGNVAAGAQARGGGIFYQAPGAPVQLNGSFVTSNRPDNCFPPGIVNGCQG